MRNWDRGVLLDGVWELVAAGHALDDYVLVLDARGFEGFLCAGKERVNYLGVPARVHDADSEAGT